jgi:hypothetical protein
MNFSKTGSSVAASANSAIRGDRRSDRRYEIALDVRWKLIRRRRVLDAGVGATLDLSSGGILFEAERALPTTGNVELSIAWPVLLHNVSPMQLFVTGKIVRAAGRRIAIRMSQHEFRTLRVAAEANGAVSAGPVLISSRKVTQ